MYDDENGFEYFEKIHDGFWGLKNNDRELIKGHVLLKKDGKYSATFVFFCCETHEVGKFDSLSEAQEELIKKIALRYSDFANQFIEKSNAIWNFKYINSSEKPNG